MHSLVEPLAEEGPIHRSKNPIAATSVPETQGKEHALFYCDILTCELPWYG